MIFISYLDRPEFEDNDGLQFVDNRGQWRREDITAEDIGWTVALAKRFRV